MEDDKPKNGRPSDFTVELAEKICDRIANSSDGLTTICKSDEFPARSTVYEWLKAYGWFADMYARSKELQADFLAEELLDIADDSSRDTLIRQDSRGESYEVCNNEWVNRSRLRVDTRKWILAKLQPRKYGDRVTNEHTIPNDKENKGPVKFTLQIEKNNAE